MDFDFRAESGGCQSSERLALVAFSFHSAICYRSKAITGPTYIQRGEEIDFTSHGEGREMTKKCD